jgi:hypothetical protein
MSSVFVAWIAMRWISIAQRDGGGLWHRRPPAYVALFASYSALRQEIAFLPAAAVALVLVGELGWRYRQRRGSSPPAGLARADARI